MGVKGKKKKGGQPSPSPLNTRKEGNDSREMAVEPSPSPSTAEEDPALLLTSQELTEIVGAAVEERFVSQNLLSSQELADIARVAVVEKLINGAEGEETIVTQNGISPPRVGANGTCAGQNHTKSAGGGRDRTTPVHVRDPIDGHREEALQIVPPANTLGLHRVHTGPAVCPEEASCEAHQNAGDDGRGGGIRRRLKVPRDVYNGDRSKLYWIGMLQYIIEEIIKFSNAYEWALSILAACLLLNYVSRFPGSLYLSLTTVCYLLLTGSLRGDVECCAGNYASWMWTSSCYLISSCCPPGAIVGYLLLGCHFIWSNICLEVTTRRGFSVHHVLLEIGKEYLPL